MKGLVKGRRGLTMTRTLSVGTRLSREACDIKKKQEKSKRPKDNFRAKHPPEWYRQQSAQYAQRPVVEAVPSEYQRYLRSDHWRMFRWKILAERERTCEICQGRYQNRGYVELHHLTYARLGHERPEDVQVVCSVCHRACHKDSVTPTRADQREQANARFTSGSPTIGPCSDLAPPGRFKQY